MTSVGEDHGQTLKDSGMLDVRDQLAEGGGIFTLGFENLAFPERLRWPEQESSAQARLAPTPRGQKMPTLPVPFDVIEQFPGDSRSAWSRRPRARSEFDLHLTPTARIARCRPTVSDNPEYCAAVGAVEGER